MNKKRTVTDTIIRTQKRRPNLCNTDHCMRKKKKHTTNICWIKKKMKMCDNNVTLAEIFRKVIHSKSSLYACLCLFLFPFSRLLLSCVWCFFSRFFYVLIHWFVPHRLCQAVHGECIWIWNCVSCAFVCVSNDRVCLGRCMCVFCDHICRSINSYQWSKKKIVNWMDSLRGQ